MSVIAVSMFLPPTGNLPFQPSEKSMETASYCFSQVEKITS